MMNALAEQIKAERRNSTPVILIVDDDPGVRRALRRCLRGERYELITAESGDQALERIADGPVDLVIADQRMPGMWGTDLLQEIRERSPRTPCAILTAFHTLSVIRDGIDAGAATILFKPWKDGKLRSTVRRLLGGAPGGNDAGSAS